MPRPITARAPAAPTSRIMRRRLRADAARTVRRSPPRGRCVRRCLGFGAGTIFRAFSLMSLSSDCLSLVRVAGDGRAQVVFHRAELAAACARSRRRSPSSTVSIMSAPRSAKRSSSGRAAGVRYKPLGAAIVRIGAALDQAVVAEPVDQPRQRDRLQVEHFGEFGLLEALARSMPHQHRPLRAGHAELARPLVGIGSQQAGYVHDCKGKFRV